MTSQSLRAKWLTPFLLASTVSLTACDDSDSSDDSETSVTVQFVNAIPDSPSISLTVDTDPEVDDDEDEIDLLSSLSFQQGYTTQAATVGEITFELTYEDPATDDTETLIDTSSLTLAADTLYTVIFTGTFDAPTILVLDKPVGDLSDSDIDEAEFQIVNLSSGETLDVYIDDVDARADLPVATLDSGGFTDTFRLLTEPEYALYITSRGLDERIYDVGELTFSALSRRTLIITDELSDSDVGITAFLMTEGGASITFDDLIAEPKLRLTNAVPDLLAADISVIESFDGAIQNNVSINYQETTDYFSTDLDAVFLDVNFSDATGAIAASYETIVSLDQSNFYTLVFAGNLDEAATTSRLISIDERPRATQTNVTFVNAVNLSLDDEDPLDLEFYVLEAGESIEAVQPSTSALGFLDSTTRTFPAKPTVLIATDSSTDNIVAGPIPVIFESKQSLLITVTESPGGGQPLSINIHQRNN